MPKNLVLCRQVLAAQRRLRKTEGVTNEATLYRCVEKSALVKVGSEGAVTNVGLSTTFDPEGSGVWMLTWR